MAKPEVVSMPSPNFNSRDGAKPDTIVLHHTADSGTAQSVGRYFQQKSAQVSSHYIVGKDGTIVQSVQDGDRAWHAGVSEFKGRQDVNDFSLGIEIANLGDGKDPYTDAQYQSLARLVAYLMDTYGISWERVTGHKDVALPRGRKNDPSANFSYDRLREEVAKLKGSPAPARPSQAAAVPAAAGTYKVVSGDTLYGIARRLLGDGNRWRDLFEANRDQLQDPAKIFPGQVLKLPQAQGNAAPKPPAPVAPPKAPTPPKQAAVPPAVPPKPAAPPVPAAPAQPSAPNVTGETYVAQPGDTVWSIAERVLGDKNQWQALWTANRDVLANPNLLYPGQALRLPTASVWSRQLDDLRQELEGLIARA